jgi:hypothetical protein
MRRSNRHPIARKITCLFGTLSRRGMNCTVQSFSLSAPGVPPPGKAEHRFKDFKTRAKRRSQLNQLKPLTVLSHPCVAAF